MFVDIAMTGQFKEMGGWTDRRATPTAGLSAAQQSY